jgi:hypothetical protein
MGIRDRITDTMAGAISGGLGLFTEALAKANDGGVEEPGVRDDEPARRQTDGTTAMAMTTERAPLPPDPPVDDPKGLLYDPFALIDQLGYRDRPSALTYNTLREMAKRVPTYTAILQTRVNQVSSFGHRQKDRRDPGFSVELRDDKATPSDLDNQRMRQIEDFLLQTGTEWHPGRDTFKTFLRKLVRDTLVMDQACFEVQRNRKGLPAAFYALDAATFRMADVPPGADARMDPDQVKYVQVYDEVIIAEFAAQDMCFGVRNPRSDIRVNGYGFSELEMLINVITASLWSFDYNKRQFSQGTLINGVMNFKGSVPDKKVDAFRRQWKLMVSGVNNSHRVPMTNVDELQWIDFGKSNRDMEYSAWMDWLIKVTCAVCQFDPAEINFTYGNSGQASQMFTTPVGQKLKESRDKGLKPLLDDIASWINVHLVWPLDPYFEFKFKGMDGKDSDQAIDQQKKRVEYLITVDEARAEEDLPPLPDGAGDVILNTVWMQNKQAASGMGGMDDGMGGYDEEGGDEQLGDVTSLDTGGDGNDLSTFDFDALFPEQKSVRRVDGGEELEKSSVGKIRVYEIDL